MYFKLIKIDKYTQEWQYCNTTPTHTPGTSLMWIKTDLFLALAGVAQWIEQQDYKLRGHQFNS